ncbi:MAG: type II toxin-antitoxin system VapC family toxin [Cyanobacteria bacterium M_surface_10_m2_119]|nr:type II toxin-antitoxin system VapC family toxin [Cyanobacteria bacterium M_surface_10_m2_119]
MFLLDTNVVSELRRAGSGRADPGVVAWAEQADPAALFLSVVSLHELELGVRLEQHRDPRQGQLLRQWLDQQVVPAFAGRILPVDEAVARCSAALHVPDPRPLRDGLIAATALVHAMVVVTRNVGDFLPTGVDVLNPWRDLLR